MTTLWVLLHVAAQRDYELHSLDFSTTFLQYSLHEEIWLRRPPGFTRTFPVGTQWSLCRPVYGLRQAPREWHDKLRSTLAALGFAPSIADPSLFLRTDTSLPPFYVLVYVDDLVFATADTEALTLVMFELQKRHTCTDLGELHSYLGLQINRDRAWRTITLTQSHMVHQVLQRFGFQFSSPQPTPLSTSHSLSAPPSDESVTLPRGTRQGQLDVRFHRHVKWVQSRPHREDVELVVFPVAESQSSPFLLQTTLAALGFAPATANPSLFLRIDTSLLPFYVLVYFDDLVFAPGDTEALTLVLQRFVFQFSSPQPTPLSTSHSLSAPPSDESVEPSGPYPELVGCLMYLITCTLPDLAYPLSLLARYEAPSGHQKVHWDAGKRVLRHLCSTSGMGLVLGGRGPVVLTGHADASWPRSPPVLYVDNKAMIALCQEHRLEHRTKHITLRYFLAQELQQRGQLRFAYVATRANTADVFTKAFPPGEHQRFATLLGFVPTLPHLLTA
ncbi:unnamed protein product [Closterium sp. NIES-54]